MLPRRKQRRQLLRLGLRRERVLVPASGGPAPPLASSTAAAVGGSLAGTSVGGWALAAALLLAVRLGREAADEERTDLFALQERKRQEEEEAAREAQRMAEAAEAARPACGGAAGENFIEDWAGASLDLAGDAELGIVEVPGPHGMRGNFRGSLVPVPERLWASRNVANNLLRFGEPLQVGEALRMLEEAAAVAAARAKAATELLEVVQGICERYQASRDLLSCVLLLEAAVGEVMTARRDGELPKLLRRLGRDASEELGAYASGRRNKWLDAWARGSGALPPLRP
eukprot:XP_001699071.1 predicted protein [Chlamydomonas reinhardtii]